MVPLDRDRSEWQTPAAASAMRTWPGPGSGRTMSVISSGAPTAGSTAARTTNWLLGFVSKGYGGQNWSDFVWRYSARPCGPSSRPTPDCL